MNNKDKVFKTTNYAIFRSLRGNRSVNPLHVERLKKSMEKSHLLSPILVNEKHQIIDGQHRYEAMKELGLEISYIFADGYGLEEVQTLNTNSANWRKTDYLNAFCDLGKKEYLNFRKFWRRYPMFGISACEALLTNKATLGKVYSNDLFKSETNKDGKIQVRTFQEGAFEISDYNQASKKAEAIIQLARFYEGYNRSAFVRAMIPILDIRGFEIEQLLTKMSYKKDMVYHCSTVRQYKAMLEDLYNYKSRKKIRLQTL